MSLLGMRVEHRLMLEGCSAGLAEPTAIVDIAVDGVVGEGAFDRIRAGAAELYPHQPLYGVGESDWPAAFLVGNVGADDAAERLGSWVVALTIALQRWSRDPVWRGRVVTAGPNRMRLAIPWGRADIFGNALDLALRLIEQVSAPTPDRFELQRLHRQALSGVESGQSQGLLPNTLRFIQAAVLRGIPFDVRPACVQFGQGAAAELMDSSFTGRTALLGSMMVRNKSKANDMLKQVGLPSPAGRVGRD